MSTSTLLGATLLPEPGSAPSVTLLVALALTTVALVAALLVRTGRSRHRLTRSRDSRGGPSPDSGPAGIWGSSGADGTDGGDGGGGGGGCD